MKTVLLVLAVLGTPLLVAAGWTSVDDIHCWLQHFGIL